MTLYPEVQSRGQEEIDRVVGRERVPKFSDMEELVYVRAMVKEVTLVDQTMFTDVSSCMAISS